MKELLYDERITEEISGRLKEYPLEEMNEYKDKTVLGPEEALRDSIDSLPRNFCLTIT